MILSRRLFLAPGLLAAATLAGCGSDPQPAPSAEANGSGAAGEVQGGSISDAMLPLESVTSQAPSRGGEGDNEEGGGEASGGAGEADAEASGTDQASDEDAG